MENIKQSDLTIELIDAIIEGDKYSVDINACEGCAVCGLVCPVNAIGEK